MANFHEKTILVIGNGFDIAHGLPTQYMDFLDFIDEKNIRPRRPIIAGMLALAVEV